MAPSASTSDTLEETSCFPCAIEADRNTIQKVESSKFFGMVLHISGKHTFNTETILR